MGNNCSSCSGIQCCCFGSRKNKKGGKMVASDLHSSGAQEITNKKTVVQSRPTSLPTLRESNAPSTSGIQTQPGGNGAGRFNEFSLHGVQKTSPVEQSDDNTAEDERIIQHKFLVENVTRLFNEYKEEDCDEILEDGIAKFCNDLEVDPAEFIVLALAWKFKAVTMCKFTRDEFMQGCIALQSDSIKSLQESFPNLEKDATKNFKDIYKFAFQFGLDSEQGQRSLPSEVAIGMWQVVFSKTPPILLNDWLKFLEESKIRGISRDTWNMFLHFTENVGADLSNYDDNEAWPSLFDDFVEYFRNRNLEIEKESIEEEENTAQTQLPSFEEPIHVDMTQADLNLPGRVPVQSSDEENISMKELIFEKESEDTIPETLPAESATLQTYLLEKDSENIKSTLNNSLGDLPSTSQQNTEIDTEPIRCDTLHSSHST